MPFPLNQSRKRFSIGPPFLPFGAAANAVPLVLNIAASGGSPTRTTAPVRLTPRRNLRLLSAIAASSSNSRFGNLIMVQTADKFRGTNQPDQKLFELES